MPWRRCLRRLWTPGTGYRRHSLGFPKRFEPKTQRFELEMALKWLKIAQNTFFSSSKPRFRLRPRGPEVMTHIAGQRYGCDKGPRLDLSPRFDGETSGK